MTGLVKRSSCGDGIWVCNSSSRLAKELPLPRAKSTRSTRSLPNVLNFQSNNFRVRVDPKFADSLLVMDNKILWNDDYGANWFLNAMVGVGSMLGLGLANDLPVSTSDGQVHCDIAFPQ